MEIFISLIVLILAIVVSYIVAEAFYEAASDKGYNSRKYFWMCFLLGLVGYLLVAALPDRGTPARELHKDRPSGNGYRQMYAQANTPVQKPMTGAAQAEHQIFSDGSWQCTCGRRNMRYITSCVCGKSKHQ